MHIYMHMAGIFNSFPKEKQKEKKVWMWHLKLAEITDTGVTLDFLLASTTSKPVI
jgi:hypothetical protein